MKIKIAFTPSILWWRNLVKDYKYPILCLFQIPYSLTYYSSIILDSSQCISTWKRKQPLLLLTAHFMKEMVMCKAHTKQVIIILTTTAASKSFLEAIFF